MLIKITFLKLIFTIQAMMLYSHILFLVYI